MKKRELEKRIKLLEQRVDALERDLAGGPRWWTGTVPLDLTNGVTWGRTGCHWDRWPDKPNPETTDGKYSRYPHPAPGEIGASKDND